MTTNSDQVVYVYYGEELAEYGFGHGHPFGTDRLAAFWDSFQSSDLADQVCIRPPCTASREEIESFHTREYVDQVIRQSASGHGYLDYGDTPAYQGVYEASATVVGTALAATRRLLDGSCLRAFVPIAGLHHARRDRAGGFCVLNDCGVIIEILRAQHGLQRIAYVDIDAHHGDGVFYGFEDDPDLIIADIHEDGRFLYPGTGFSHETGSGSAVGTKLNIPVRPGAGDDVFNRVWQEVLHHIDTAAPELIMLQCGADALEGDPLTHLRYSVTAYRQAASDLRQLADRHCRGRIIALGGGGYNHQNIAAAWTAVIRAFLP